MDMQSAITNLMNDCTFQSCLKIECSDHISDQILEILVNMDIKVGCVLRDESLYEQMRVHEYLKFFAEVHQHKNLLKEAIEQMQLRDLLHVKTNVLTHAQGVRIAIARAIIQDPKVFFLQEPLKDVDDTSYRIILEWIDCLSNFQKSIVVTSMSLKQLYLIDGETYYMNAKEIQRLEHEENTLDTDTKLTLNEKISVRSGDKILLFHPIDIEYVESMEGKTYVNVRHDVYVYNGTLDELELKLKRYGFYRCHRSYLVNMQKVSEVVKWTRNSYSLKLESLEDVKIPLSKGRIDEMKELYHL